MSTEGDQRGGRSAGYDGGGPPPSRGRHGRPDDEQQEYGGQEYGGQSYGRHGGGSPEPGPGYGPPQSSGASSSYGPPPSYGRQGHGSPPSYGSTPGRAETGHRAPPATNRSTGVATGGFVVGLIGFLLSFIPLIGIIAWPLVIIGLALSIVGLIRARRHGGRGLAVAGTVLSAIGLIVCILYATAFARAVNDLPSAPVPGAAPAAPGSTAAPARTAAFGAPLTFDNGLQVTIAPPATFRPSSSAAGVEGAAKVFQMRITIRNGTNEVFQPATTSISATVDGQEAQSVFDSQRNVLGPPSTSVQPGRTTTYTVAFSSPVPSGELQVDVRPGFVLEPGTYTGRL